MKCKSCKRDIPDESIFCLHCGERIVARKNKTAVSVPKPTQLADGSYFARIMINGTRYAVHGSTLKEYEAQARAIKTGIIPVADKKSLTLGNAIDDFLKNNDSLLDPSTIRSYKSNRKYRFQKCMSWNIFDDNPWQKAINDECKEVSAKTVRNAWGLITSAMSYHKAPLPSVKLPRRVKVERPWLDYKQIEVFLKAVHGKECELGALLALHSMRLSELIAVTPDRVDLIKGEIAVRGARVLNDQHEIVYKPLNKTEASHRNIPIIIPRLTELLTPDVMSREYIADTYEKRLYDSINSVCASAGLPKVGVHGLRHSFASLAYHLGWQKMSTMTVGGWTNSKIVDEIYTHNADLDRDIETMRKYYKSHTDS